MSDSNDARSSGEVDRDALPRYWSSALAKAIYSDEHTVELVDGDGCIQVEIDGVPMFNESNGYVSEIFNVALGNDYYDYFTPAGLDKISEVDDAE